MRPALADVLADLDGTVLTSTEVLTSRGVTEATVRWQCRPGGPWQRLFSDVVLLQAGPVPPLMWAAAATLHAGPPVAVTGALAGLVLGVPLGPILDIPLLLPHHRRLRSRSPVRWIRTRDWPDVRPTEIAGCTVYVVDLDRAAVDALRMATDPMAARALLHTLLSERVIDLETVRGGLRRGVPNPVARALLADLGVWSEAEAEALSLVRRSSVLPEPECNVVLVDAQGRHLATPDGLFRSAALAYEIDSRTHHSGVTAWAETLDRGLRLTDNGVCVLHLSPRQVRRDGARVLRVLERLFEERVGRGLPPGVQVRGR